jgi:Ala-tRNA(Pro) deacylase
MSGPAQEHHDRIEGHGLRAVTDYLDGEGVAFDVVEHPTTATAAAESRVLHVPPDQMAKTVLLHDGANWVTAVVPASHRLDVHRLRTLLDAGAGLALATEEQIAEHFPRVEVGAVPPVGAMLVGATVVDERLTAHDRIVCAGGDHEHGIRMSPHDVVRLSGAHVADICEP